MLYPVQLCTRVPPGDRKAKPAHQDLGEGGGEIASICCISSAVAKV